MISARELPIANLLDEMCPLHAVVNRTGHIIHAGPTLTKMALGSPVVGLRLGEVLEVMRPKLGSNMGDLLAAAGKRLHLRLRLPPMTELKGVLMPLPDGVGPDGGALLNLSFGISLPEAVRDFNLTSSDFAATDQAIEMLYLFEAKSAAMDASRKLNTRLEGARIAAQEQAFTDTLTGLKNRRAFDPIVKRLQVSQISFALVQLDLDFFKSVNDTMGHAAGDFVLQEVGQRLLEETRKKDAILRVGGDEFVLILPDMECRKTLGDLCGRLIAALEEPYVFNGQDCRVSASIGAVLSSDYPGTDTDEMMCDADVALYAAKAAGRQTYRLFSQKLCEPTPVVSAAGRAVPLSR